MTNIDMGFWDNTFADLQRLAGPLESVQGPLSAFESFTGTYRNWPVVMHWLGRVSDGIGGSVLRIGATLGDRPVRTYVWARKGSTILGPTAVTGDEQFDETYVAAARPQQVVSEALDAEVRAMIDRRWAGRDTSIDAKDGWVSLEVARSGAGPKGPRTPPTTEELQAALDDVVLLADRLCGSYDRAKAAVAAQQGETAAAAWEQQARQDSADSATKGRLLAAAIIIGFLAVVAVIVLVVLSL